MAPLLPATPRTRGDDRAGRPLTRHVRSRHRKARGSRQRDRVGFRRSVPRELHETVLQAPRAFAVVLRIVCLDRMRQWWRSTRGERRLHSRSGDGFTADFRTFVMDRGLDSFDFARAHLAGCSSYGGRARHDEALVNGPVAFVHGNSDRGLGGSVDGYRESLEAFRAAGYRSRELYTFTWLLVYGTDHADLRKHEWLLTPGPSRPLALSGARASSLVSSRRPTPRGNTSIRFGRAAIR